MKNIKNGFWGILFVIVFVIISCRSINKEDGQSENDSLKTSITDTVNVKIDSLSGLEEFPKKWIKITEKDSGRVIFNPCDASNHMILIEKRNETYYLIYIWGHEATEHKISSFNKTGEGKYKIGAYFGENHFYYDIKVIDRDILLAAWNWGWQAAFDKREDNYTSLFVPEEYTGNFEIIDQPCLECWEPDVCIDYVKQYIGKPFEKLLNDSNFQYRLSILYKDDNTDFMDMFDKNELIVLTNDQYIVMHANIKDGGEPVEKIFVIDVEKSIIGSAFTKSGKYMYAICEVNEDLYPKPLSEWISKRK